MIFIFCCPLPFFGEWLENQILIPDWTYFHCPGATQVDGVSACMQASLFPWQGGDIAKTHLLGDRVEDAWWTRELETL